MTCGFHTYRAGVKVGCTSDYDRFSNALVLPDSDVVIVLSEDWSVLVAYDVDDYLCSARAGGRGVVCHRQVELRDRTTGQ